MQENDVPTFTLQDDDLKRYLIEQWNIKHEAENVFRYKLQVEEHNTLSGKFNFFIQVSTPIKTDNV